MDTEKDFLKRDLEKAESAEEVKGLVEDAKMMGHEDIVNLAEQKLEAIQAKAKSAETTTPAQVAQVESMGGSGDQVAKRTEGVDKEIEAVQAETATKIAEVGKEVPVAEVSTSPEAQTSEMKDSPEMIAWKKEIEEFSASFKKKQEEENRLLGKVYISGNLIPIEEAVKNKKADEKIDLFQYTANKLNINAIVESGLVSPEEFMDQIRINLGAGREMLATLSPESISKLKKDGMFSKVVVLCYEQEKLGLESVDFRAKASGLLNIREFMKRYEDILAENGVRIDRNKMAEARDKIVQTCNKDPMGGVQLLSNNNYLKIAERAFDSVNNRYFKREDLLRWCKGAVEYMYNHGYNGGHGNARDVIMGVLSLKEKKFITEEEANEILKV